MLLIVLLPTLVANYYYFVSLLVQLYFCNFAAQFMPQLGTNQLKNEPIVMDTTETYDYKKGGRANQIVARPPFPFVKPSKKRS